MSKRISVDVGRETEVVSVRRSVHVCCGCKCLAVGKLMSRVSVNMICGCEARHCWGCLAATKEGGERVSQKPRRKGREGGVWRCGPRGGYKTEGDARTVTAVGECSHSDLGVCANDLMLLSTPARPFLTSRIVLNQTGHTTRG